MIWRKLLILFTSLWKYLNIKITEVFPSFVNWSTCFFVPYIADHSASGYGFFFIFISWYGNIITKSVCICSGVYSAHCIKDSIVAIPGSKVHGASMGPIWGRQAPGGPHVGPMNFAIWGFHVQTVVHSLVILLLYHTYASVRPVLCLLLIKLVKLIKMALNIISVDSAL